MLYLSMVSFVFESFAIKNFSHGVLFGVMCVSYKQVEAGWQFGNDILDGAVAALFPSRILTMGSKRKLQSRQCLMRALFGAFHEGFNTQSLKVALLPLFIVPKECSTASSTVLLFLRHESIMKDLWARLYFPQWALVRLALFVLPCVFNRLWSQSMVALPLKYPP